MCIPTIAWAATDYSQDTSCTAFYDFSNASDLDNDLCGTQQSFDTVIGSPTRTTTTRTPTEGFSVLLDGNDAFINSVNIPDFNKRNFAAGCLVRFTSVATGSNQAIFGQGDNNISGWKIMFQDSSDKMEHEIELTSGLIAKSTLLAGNWYYIITSYSDADDVVNMYNNGVNDCDPDAASCPVVTPGVRNNTSVPRIGVHRLGNSNFLNGNVQECFYMARSITPEEACEISRFTFNGSGTDAGFSCNTPAEAPADILTLNSYGGILINGTPFFPRLVWNQPLSNIATFANEGMNPIKKPGGEPISDYLLSGATNSVYIAPSYEGELSGITAEWLFGWETASEPDLEIPTPYSFSLDGNETNIVLEGENVDISTFVDYSFLQGPHNNLSATDWRETDAAGTGSGTWNFTVPSTDIYDIWVREYDKIWSNPTSWFLDSDTPIETSRSLMSQERMSSPGGNVGWVQYADNISITAGAHTITMSPVAGRTVGDPNPPYGTNAVWAIDVIVITTADTFPPGNPQGVQPRVLPSVVQATADTIKGIDPQAATWITFSPRFYPPKQKIDTQYYLDFINTSDIITFDHYPVTGFNTPDKLYEIGMATETLLGLIAQQGTPKPVITIIESADQRLSFTPPETRGPTPDETEAEVWMAIAKGARGIGYFPIAFNPFTWNNETAEMATRVTAINTEIGTVEAPLAAGEYFAALTSGAPGPSLNPELIHAGTKQYQGQGYLVAANSENIVHNTVTVNLTQTYDTTATVLGESRTVSITGGPTNPQIVDNFTGLQHHIYQFDVDQDDDTVFDNKDLCQTVSDVGQTDSDSDLYGNACDADFDQDFDIDGIDFLTFRGCYQVGTTCPGGTCGGALGPDPTCEESDMNGDTNIDGTDFLLFRSSFIAGIPGPSALTSPGTASATSTSSDTMLRNGHIHLEVTSPNP